MKPYPNLLKPLDLGYTTLRNRVLMVEFVVLFRNLIDLFLGFDAHWFRRSRFRFIGYWTT